MVNALAGLADGARLSQGFQDTYDNSRLNMLAGKAYTAPPEQRQSLLGNMAAVNPQAAQAQQQQWQGDEDRQTKLLVNGARYMKGALDSKNPNAVSGAWNSLRPAIIRAGLATEQELSPTWDPSYETTMHQLLGMGGAETSAYNQNKVIGDSLVGPDGRVIYQSERQPEYMWSDRAGAWIPNPNNALIGGSQSNPQGTPANPLEQGGSQAEVDANASLANQLIAAGIPEAQVDAFLAARMNPNGGPAASAAPGTLDPVRVAGVGPKPEISAAEQMRLDMAREASARADRADARADRAEQRQVSANAVTGKPPSEGERKAATLLQRLNFSQQQLNGAVQDDPNAAAPGILQSGVRAVFGDSASNTITHAARQRVEAAQLDILDAALTLGTGAAYTREQLEGYRRSYFPQIGDSQATIKDKSARLQNVIEAAKIAAGRAAPGQDAAAQPQPMQSAPASDFSNLWN
ncbi:hypothetical protein ABB26_04955 [Stenotrophomonas humi]|uniref:Uncharacterized protein n=1 Tax=Stenotrophomonas humi TaxID=405444 RepID=A0A0R0CGI4_9GAMM|nr:hypothetical protein [Stenotrophomonas humi]KRG65166.1 hypothetical protein ABB26_04955 [Stenotrophomonas humi]